MKAGRIARASLALSGVLLIGAGGYFLATRVHDVSQGSVSAGGINEGAIQGRPRSAPVPEATAEQRGSAPDEFRLMAPGSQEFNPTTPGQIRQSYWVFDQAQNETLARRRREQGFPPDFDYRSWNRLAVEAAADEGDLMALNQRAVLRLMEGREDWMDHEPLIRGSGFYARLRAAEAWGLVSTEGLNRSRGGNAARTVPVKNVTAGLAWDLVTQYFGHMPLLLDSSGQLRGPNARALQSISFVEVFEAEEMALSILRYVNDERRRRGWPPLRAQWSTR